jgi:hypothetical protein
MAVIDIRNGPARRAAVAATFLPAVLIAAAIGAAAGVREYVLEIVRSMGKAWRGRTER